MAIQDTMQTYNEKILEQEKEIETLRKWQRDMVAKMAEDHDLAGYRELGEKLAARDEEIETLRSALDETMENWRLSMDHAESLQEQLQAANKFTGQLMGERDEQKRRAAWLYEHPYKIIDGDLPEDWFEEE